MLPSASGNSALGHPQHGGGDSFDFRPRATVHRVIHSTEGVIVLTVAQKVMK